LFLDELPEFRRHVLDALRQPVEDGVVSIGRARQVVTYPAQFMLAAAMNPCPCGFHGAAQAACTCALHQVERYMARVSGPLFDRIDVQVIVPAVSAQDLTSRTPGEGSAAMRARVEAARDRQLTRFRDRAGVYANAHMSPRDIRELCPIDARSEELLRGAIQKLGLSARAYHRVLRLARTVADLAGADRIAPIHVAEAIHYRSLDRRPLHAAR
jgi:magnesium chelatase family protein